MNYFFRHFSKGTLIYPDGKVIKWIPFDYIEGNEGMFFVRLDGNVPMGLTKLQLGVNLF